MTDAPQDEARLHATEAQMRRALGLDDRTLSRPDAEQITGLNRQRRQRHFVRDGEVPVTVIHRDGGGGINQLEAARETIRSLTAAQEESERSLAAAQETIRDLQPKLAHEHIARDEAARGFEADKLGIEQALQSVQAELAAELDARQQAEERLAEALKVGQVHRLAQAVSSVSEQPVQSRRRHRLRKVEGSESEFVEWWKPGWQGRYR